MRWSARCVRMSAAICRGYECSEVFIVVCHSIVLMPRSGTTRGQTIAFGADWRRSLRERSLGRLRARFRVRGHVSARAVNGDVSYVLVEKDMTSDA